MGLYVIKWFEILQIPKNHSAVFLHQRLASRSQYFPLPISFHHRNFVPMSVKLIAFRPKGLSGQKIFSWQFLIVFQFQIHRFFFFLFFKVKVHSFLFNIFSHQSQNFLSTLCHTLVYFRVFAQHKLFFISLYIQRQFLISQCIVKIYKMRNGFKQSQYFFISPTHNHFWNTLTHFQ